MLCSVRLTGCAAPLSVGSVAAPLVLDPSSYAEPLFVLHRWHLKLCFTCQRLLLSCLCHHWQVQRWLWVLGPPRSRCRGRRSCYGVNAPNPAVAREQWCHASACCNMPQSPLVEPLSTSSHSPTTGMQLLQLSYKRWKLDLFDEVKVLLRSIAVGTNTTHKHAHSPC